MTIINLSKLPPPKIIEELDVEQIKEEMKTDFLKRMPDGYYLDDADPAMKLIEQSAYREMLQRQKINDGAKAVMLGYSTGNDLEQLTALFNTERSVIVPKTNQVKEIKQSDHELREEALTAFDGKSTAGAEETYIYFAKKFNRKIIHDVSVHSSLPGTVELTILFKQGIEVDVEAELNGVKEYLSGKKLNPFTDNLIVNTAQVTVLGAKANILVPKGPDREVIKKRATERLNRFLNERYKLGSLISLSGINSALYVENVEEVEIIEPKMSINNKYNQAVIFEDFEIEVVEKEDNL